MHELPRPPLRGLTPSHRFSCLVVTDSPEAREQVKRSFERSQVRPIFLTGLNETCELIGQWRFDALVLTASRSSKLRSGLIQAVSEALDIPTILVIEALDTPLLPPRVAGVRNVTLLCGRVEWSVVAHVVRSILKLE